MRRRSLLQACSATVVGAAGCVADGELVPTKSWVDSGIETTIEPAAEAASEPLVEISGDVLTDPSTESPLRIELALQNVTSQQHGITANSTTYPFEHDLYETGAPPGLFLLSTTMNAIPEDPIDGCWPVIPDRPVSLLTILSGPITPDETLSHQFDVVYSLPRENDESPESPTECYSPGTHEFEGQVSVGSVPHNWTATLTIAE